MTQTDQTPRLRAATTLRDTLERYDAKFNWNAEFQTWCLSGSAQGLGWETDDYKADNRDHAESDALDYLIEYNHNHNHAGE